ncbi:reprolysin-like metallopeptidase [Capnocytophaga sp.]|uniref:reprolysin-like metallopeptidase n=1 Tax=Capnocytophaga sp. TaxID=44737 RepID=UPI0026DC943C|nr:gliding motility-associated C-terminal domain-containing protein [Capnocytophaga sp.]MDO5105036.1 gliding motility-associated C-terminal domain-containing protein [Capnocytophaga sp.]
MKKLWLLWVVMVSFWGVAAQETFKTNVKSEEVIRTFSTGGTKTWGLPLPDGKTLSLTWYERSSAFTQANNVRTFVGYQGSDFVATLALAQSSVSGNVTYGSKSYLIETSEDGFLLIKHPDHKAEDHKCGLCADGKCHTQAGKTARPSAGAPSSPNSKAPSQLIVTDGVLRVYRLAVVVSSDTYHNDLKDNMTATKAFLAQLESYLNELYMRDLGIKFEMVQDDKLIITDYSKDDYSYKSANYLSSSATTYSINSLIGKENYDVGIVITKARGNVSGQAVVGGAYYDNLKGSGFAIYNFKTISHEMGHLFGSQHTFTHGGVITYFTEPEKGQSVMSYGFNFPRDFFSLVSTHFIRNYWLTKNAYYINTERTQFNRKDGDYTNHSYGYRTNNTPPVINRAKVKAKYVLPQDTYFQFRIDATDKEQSQLWYAAHQADLKQQGKAKFIAKKPTNNPLITFQKEYHPTAYYDIPYSDFTKNHPQGEFTFWLGVNDYNPADQNHATHYDAVETKVEIKNGTPFKITSAINKQYQAGQKVTLQWGVDSAIFGNDSKVRILLSDDLGLTYKHVLVAEAPNNGSCEVTLPNIEIGKKQLYFEGGTKGPNIEQGAFKIEVLDHIAFAITEDDPFRGGFEVTRSAIKFVDTPSVLYVKTKSEAESTPKADVKAESTCTTGNVSIAYAQDATKNPITRTWTATDGCNNMAAYTQYIYYETDRTSQPLQLAGVPADVVLGCKDPIPTPANVTVSGGCNPQLIYTENPLGENACGRQIVRKWIATDDCQPAISHTQYITIADTEPPVFQETLPQNITIYEGETVPQQAFLTVKDNCRTREMYVDRNEKEEKEGDVVKKIYTWQAQDDCFNIVTHTQTITILPRNATRMELTKTPENVSVSCDNIPNADTSSVQVSGCDKPTITHSDVRKNGNCLNNYTIERTYTVTGCGQSLSHTQIITVSDTQAPVFVGNLPVDITVEEGNIPSQAELTAQDNCTNTVQMQKRTEETQENGNRVLIYKWIISDPCGNTAEHHQKVTVLSKKTETPGGGTPNPDNLADAQLIVYNAVSTETGSENYFKMEPLEHFTQLSVEIFNELGQKVYQAKDYQRKGGVFRGYTNLNGVVGKGKRLPTGTYFYILKYQDPKKQKHIKQGYLFVR